MSIPQTKTYTVAVVVGIAQLLATAGVGTYDPDAVVSTLERPIVHGDIPESADVAFAVNHYLDVAQGVGVWDSFVQVRVRGTTNPLDSLRLLDAVTNALHDQTHVDLGPVRATRIMRDTMARFVDGSGRYGYTINFRIRGARVPGI